MVTATKTNKLTRVLDLISKGFTAKEISKKVKCTTAYVYTVKKKYADGTPTVQESKVYTIDVNPQPKTKPVSETLAERASRYGTFAKQAAISQNLKHVVRSALAEQGKFLDEDQSEALEIILHKIARIVNGDANYADSWHDIAGYAQLVETRLVTGKEI